MAWEGLQTLYLQGADTNQGEVASLMTTESCIGETRTEAVAEQPTRKVSETVVQRCRYCA
jgi:hypothetical protein